MPPDGHERGQPRWFLPTIIAALEVKPHARGGTGKHRDRLSLGRHKALDGLLVMFEKQVALLGTEPAPDKRREMALALAPLLQEHLTTYLAIGRSLCIADDAVIGARADLVWNEMMDEVSDAAAWPRDDGFLIRMIEAMADDDEAA